jgi:F0F1-type ATP synthase assembly protein I
LAEPERASSGSASQIGRYGGYGITLGLAIALFAWLGTLLDAKLGTKPLFVLVGTFVGFGGGFYRMVRDLTARPDEPDGDGA